MRYAKIAKPGGSTRIEDDEASASLEGEAGGGKWKEKSKLSLTPATALSNAVTRPGMWENSKGYTGHFEPGRHALFVETPAAEAFTQAQKDAKEKQRQSSIPKF